MDSAHFDALARTLTTAGSRRRALVTLSGVLGLVLGVSSAPDAEAKKCPPCRKRKKGTCKKKKSDGTPCPGGACQSGNCVATAAPPPPPPTPVLAYECPGPHTVSVNNAGNRRYAQTFVTAQGGSLHQIQFQILKQAGTIGDYVVELLAVVGGVPTNTVLARAVIPDELVPVGSNIPITASFSGPNLLGGTEHAVALSRPGTTLFTFDGKRSNDNACIGSTFQQIGIGSGQFTNFEMDMITAISVLP